MPASPATSVLNSGFASLLAACVTLAVPAPADAQETLRVGVLDYLSDDHALDHWRATEVALNGALPAHDVMLVPLDIDGLDAALAAGTLDFVITNPGNYAALEYTHHISRIATAEDDLPVASTLVTAGDLQTIDDLAGKRLAITSPEAFGGFQLVWSEMADADAALKERVELVVTGYPMQSTAEAVLNGDADAAVLRACMLETLQQQDPESFGALHPFALKPDQSETTGCATSSAIYPGWPFAKAQQTAPDLAKQVAVALLQMDRDNLWTVPLDYQPVHDLMRKLRIGPYARTGPVSLRDFVADYRDWLIVLVLALMFWALYSVRIETLVRRRTRDLHDANTALTHEMAERRRAEEAERQHLRELEHVARLSILGEMASSIAHELNQPLSAISSYAQGCLLRIRAGNFSDSDMALASDEIAGQAERAGTMIKRIRAFVGKRERQVAPVAASALIEDCASIYAASARRAGVEVQVEVADELPMLEVDAVQVQQVMLNLVQNGIDAMSDTAPDRRQLTIRAVARAEMGRSAGILISVRDHGHGMTPAQMDHFAEAFYTTKTEGIGLGLALSRSIIEAHDGWLRAEQPEDDQGGLRVAIWLPTGEPG